jgi:trehalose-6-phosphate synthase
MHKSVPFEELTAMYALADACLVTSTRDGMNLVAYEYISSQQVRHGTMILSEFAGAAQSLNGSLLINPCKWICCAGLGPLLIDRGCPVYCRCHPRRTDYEA